MNPFRRAQEDLTNDTYSCICHSLYAQYGRREIRRKTMEELTRLIRERIRPHVLLESWVEANVPNADINPDSMRDYRLRWLDALIEEHKHASI